MASLNDLPTDFDIEQATIARKQKFAELLMANATKAPQGEMVSGHYVKPGIMGAVNPLLSAFFGSMMQRRGDEQAKNVRERYDTALASGLENYMNTRSGKPAESMTAGQAGNVLLNDQPLPQLAEAVKPDPRRAAVQAIASGLAPLRQIGLEDIKQLGKSNDLTAKDILGLSGYDAKSRMAAAMGGGIEALAPELKEHVVNGQIVAGNPGEGYKSSGSFEDKWSEPFLLPGADGRPDLMRKNLTTGKVEKIDNAARVNVGGTNVMVKGQKAGMEEWAKLAGKTVGELSETARGSVKLLGTLNQLESSGKAGVLSGPAASPAMFVSGLAKSLGVPVDEAKLANSQTFEAASISAWQDMIKAAGGNRGVVAEEAKKIAQMVPQLVQTQQGRQQVTAFLRQAAQQSISDARQAQAEYGKALTAEDPAHFTFGLSAAQIPREGALPAAPGATQRSPSGGVTRSGW
jgi:hypothetical protein